MLPDASFSIETLIRITESDTHPNPVIPTPAEYVCLHDRELPSGVRKVVLDTGEPMPEVFQVLPEQKTPLTRQWQYFWRALCHEMTDIQWRKLLHFRRAFTNLQGYYRDGDPRVDYVNGLDIGAPLPKIETLLCGGAKVRGTETIYKGVPHLKLETLDGTLPPPAASWVLKSDWLWFEAVSVRPDGKTQSFSLSPYPERVPLVAMGDAYFPMSGLRKL